MTINSNRMYAIVFIEGDATYSNPALSFESIFLTGDHAEFKYAIQENIDPILDLKVGERLQMNFNRDNPDSAGFIKRIK